MKSGRINLFATFKKKTGYNAYHAQLDVSMMPNKDKENEENAEKVSNSQQVKDMHAVFTSLKNSNDEKSKVAVEKISKEMEKQKEKLVDEEGNINIPEITDKDLKDIEQATSNLEKIKSGKDLQEATVQEQEQNTSNNTMNLAGKKISRIKDSNAVPLKKNRETKASF